MVPFPSLILPIVLAAVLVFVASTVIHMMLGYHKHDMRAIPNEDAVLEALHKFPVPPGDYMAPRAPSMAAMKDPAFLAKLNRGPVFIATFLKPGPFNMGSSLGWWFVYCLVVGAFAAYLAGAVLAPGEAYLKVFRVTGTVAFTGYTLALWQGNIWYGKSVGNSIRHTLDGLAYALLTGGAFGWLWPK
jgi:hypothetical protein